MGRAYQVLHALAFAIGAPAYAVRAGGLRRYRAALAARFGHRTLAAPADGIWIQAVSVGEVGVAEILIRELRRRTRELPLAITTTTATGQERAQRAFPSDAVGYFPFDFWFSARRAVEAIRPALFATIETEIWPGVFEALDRANVPIALVNARISDRSFPRYSAVRRGLAPTLRRIRLALAASAADAERLTAIGVPAACVEVGGNLKFDRERVTERLPWEDQLAAWFGDRPIVVAGSTTSSDEEADVLAAFVGAANAGRRAGLVLAPRHPQRFGEAFDNARRCAPDLRLARRSEPPSGTEIDILVLDSLGELARVYAHAAAAFVGGSFDRKGGHNPIEASIYGVPVAVGPDTSNFRDVVGQLEAAGGLVVVSDKSALERTWNDWLNRPESARQVGVAGRRLVEANRGAAQRAAERLIELWRESVGRHASR